MTRTILAAIGSIFLASCATVPQVAPAARADLAPTGKLRAGINYGNPLFAKKDPKTGEGSGVAVDLARELGGQLGVPVELVGFSSAGQLTAALKAGAWDVAFLAFEQERANDIRFSAPFAEIESSYLVPAGSTLRNAAEADRAGVRIAFSAGVPRGREAGAQYLGEFIEYAKVSGFVAKSIEKSGVRGVTVAPQAESPSHIEIGGSVSVSYPR